MRKIRCEKCGGCCGFTQRVKRIGDIAEQYDLITHANGEKEKRVWGRVNERTNQILELNILGGR